MVRPKSRKSVSRQSSILKAPVVQQPLQHVKANASLHQETSITIKQKRRVSFADKKHVKEFCDSMEQGTLWDNTYEESSSEISGKINLNNQYYQTTNNDYQDINNDRVTSEHVNVMNNSLDLTEPISTMGLGTDKNENNHSSLIESNTNIGICVNKSKVIYNDTTSLNDKENAELNKTCAQDISMEITEIPYIIGTRNIIPMIQQQCDQFFEDKENIPVPNIINKSNVPSTLQHKMNKVSDKTQYFCTEELEFTECLQSVTKPSELQAKLLKVTSTVNDEDLTNQKTQIFQDVPMEITCSIPLIDKKNCIDQTIIFHDTPIDKTMVITSIMNEKEIPIPTDISKKGSNRTKLLNASMEISNHICSILHAKSDDATTSSVYYNKSTQLNDESNKYTILGPSRLSSENTKIFHNKSMDFTEALHMPKILHNNDTQKFNDVSLNPLMSNADLTSCKTQVFQDESMSITAPSHIPNILHNNEFQQVNDISINSLINNEDLMSSKTQIFQDESVAITVPLHTSNILHNNDIQKLNDILVNPLINSEDLMSSKTQIFQDESVAITVPLHTSNILHNNDIQKLNDILVNPLINSEDLMSSKTQIFQDESMVITAPLYRQNVLHKNDMQQLYEVPMNSLINNEDITSSSTKIFQNISMEITNAITNLPILSNSRKLCESTEENYVNLNKGRKDEAIFNNKIASVITNNTADSCTINCIEDFEHNNTKLAPMNPLTSLISSFVYADMIEDGSFVAAVNENERQCMTNNIEQETKCEQSNIKTKSVIDTINVEVENIQFSNRCTTKNKEIIREHGNFIEYHHEDNNIQKEKIMINKEENNQCNNPKQFLSKSIGINDDVFEKSSNHEKMCDVSTEIEMIRRNKQLNDTKKDIERNSTTFIIKPKKNSVMDIDKCTDDHSSSNQIRDRSYILSPILLSASSKNKMYIDENNSTVNLNDFYEKKNCNNSSLNEDIEHVTSHVKPKESSTIQKDTFSSLVHQLKMYMSSNDCIWDLYFVDIDKQMLVISFISTSLLIVIFTQNDVNAAKCSIKHIDIISCLENDENVQLSIAHKLLKEKINVKYVNQFYKYDESVVPLLNCISEDVKLVLDFIFDLKRLDNTNLMEINTERIKFIARSKYMNIVLEITMDIKLFDKIDSSNINILCILGTVRKEDIKELIINIKRDHRFLRTFMSDINGYIDIIEQADLVNKKIYS